MSKLETQERNLEILKAVNLAICLSELDTRAPYIETALFLKRGEIRSFAPSANQGQILPLSIGLGKTTTPVSYEVDPRQRNFDLEDRNIGPKVLKSVFIAAAEYNKLMGASLLDVFITQSRLGGIYARVATIDQVTPEDLVLTADNLDPVIQAIKTGNLIPRPGQRLG